MNTKHKLDILLDDIMKAGKYPDSPCKVIAQQRTIKMGNGDIKTQIRLTINEVDVWYQEFTFYLNDNYNLEDSLPAIKDKWYDLLIRYLVFFRLPIWKEATVDLQLKITS